MREHGTLADRVNCPILEVNISTPPGHQKLFQFNDALGVTIETRGTCALPTAKSNQKACMKIENKRNIFRFFPALGGNHEPRSGNSKYEDQLNT